MRFEFAEGEWLEVADDADLSLGEYRQLARYNDASSTDTEFAALVNDILNRVITDGHLLDRKREAVELPAKPAEYLRLPRRKWLWLLGRVFEATLKNATTSASE